MSEAHAGDPARVAVAPGTRVALTGGDGYLGRHLVNALVGYGAEVLVVDDGRSAPSRTAVPGSVSSVHADFASAESLSAMDDFGVQSVFHLAATHFVPDCERDPVSCFDNNVVRLSRLLGGLSRLQVSSVVFCSSAVVYGFADTPRTESDDLSPQHVYAQSKWMGEGLLSSFQQQRPDVRTVAARLFNLIGSGDTAAHVVPEIVKAVRSGRELVLGNTWPRRDYIHAADVADALCHLSRGSAEATAFNVGTGTGRSVMDVIDAVAGILDLTPSVVRDPARERAVDGHLVADTSRIRTETAWSPRWTFEDTMRELLDEDAAS